MTALRFAAVDLGAESGRVAVGAFDGDRLSLEVVHRFLNVPAHLPDGMHWDVLGLFRESLTGLALAGKVAGVGVDSWGCDYALLDRSGRMLGLPFHYRDRRTTGMSQRVFAIVSREELYERTGIQHLPFNTVFQLLAEPRLEPAASRIVLIPDLLNFWLTGEVTNEATIASTTALADPWARAWARDLVQRLGLPAAPFETGLVEPGAELGGPRADLDLGGVATVYTVASHDTAAAFAAAPTVGSKSAVISSGTWSLVGRTLPEPLLRSSLSNEWGIDGSTRVLRNVMGLWLVQECRRAWARDGLELEYGELESLAASVDRQVPVFDPDAEAFLQPGDMPARIAAACAATGQSPPATPGEVVRSILVSLACKYRVVLDELREATGDIDCVHIVGGGANNSLLCRLTADVAGIRVLAGPVEATALGNVVVQARAQGAFASHDEALDCIRRSFPPKVYEPHDDDGVFQRFRALRPIDAAVHATI